VIILVVAKAPVPGLAKTRLCPPATPEQAAGIAAAALLDTLDAVCAVPEAVPVVAFTGDIDQAARRDEVKESLSRTTVVWQRGENFSQRLANAHEDVGRGWPGVPVLQIGMDTPQVTPALLAGAVDRLNDMEAVLGRAADGGWWALGLREPFEADVLRDVPMSRADTGDLTYLALGHLRIGNLPVLSDVDTTADAVRVANQVPGGRFAELVAGVR
jgi:glycosyltransferase A (GT-A) superfamily protein (DUF2064 family)